MEGVCVSIYLGAQSEKISCQTKIMGENKKLLKIIDFASEPEA